jgi:iron(III) transport system permease protein
MGIKLQRRLLFLFLLGVLVVFLLWPIALTVGSAFAPAQGATLGERVASSLRYFIGADLGVLRDVAYLNGLRNSLSIAACTTLICIAMTLPLALIAIRYDFPAKSLFGGLILVPLILPPFVGAIGVRAIFGRFGALNAALMHLHLLAPDQPGIDFLGGGVGGRFWGVVVTEALHLYPILYLNLVAALANLDPALDEAAIGLGAGRWRRFWKVTLPLITPGIFAGGTIVFIWSFTELGTPMMFDYNVVTPVQIFAGVQEVANNPRPFALVVVMLAIALLLYGLGKAVFGGRAYEMQSKASIARAESRLRGLRGLAAALPFALLIGVAILPHLGVVISSLSSDGAWYRSVLPTHWTTENYANALSHELTLRSIRNSLGYASAAMVICVVMGLAISYLVARVKMRGGWLLDSLAMLPLAVPGLVMAFGYIAMSLAWPFAGAMPPWLFHALDRVLPHAWVAAISGTPLRGWFDVIGQTPNPVPLLITAYAIRRLPYVVRSVSAGLEQTSGQLEEAALNLGASTATAIRRVVLPLIAANIIAGAILAFSFSMLEVSDSLVLAQREQHYPITKAIFDFFGRLGDGPYIASAMGVWAMALLTVTLVGAGVMMGKKLGAVFRV